MKIKLRLFQVYANKLNFHQNTCMTKHVLKSYSDKRNIIIDENLGLHRGIKEYQEW